MHNTQDFIVNGVITSSPDVARAELAGEETDNRKVIKVHDLQEVMYKADEWAKMFATPGSRYHFGGVLNCAELDATAELLEALGNSEEAEDLRAQHCAWFPDDSSESEQGRHARHAPRTA
jgi:hypothetical protein